MGQSQTGRGRGAIGGAKDACGSSASGYSLVELLITLALTSIVVVAVFAAMESQTRSQAVAEQLSNINQSLRVGVDGVVRDVRLAGLRTGTLGQPAIAQAGPFQLALYADVNGSCTCGANDTRIAEDVCWGYRTSIDGVAPTPPPAPPTNGCPSLDNATLPYGDTPNGVQFYKDGLVPADPGAAPGHAELIIWTYDADDPNDDALPLGGGDNTIDEADEGRLAATAGGNCPAAGINDDDVDDSLSAGGNDRLMNLSRVIYTNNSTVDATGNSGSSPLNPIVRARVATGVFGPCDEGGAVQRPADEVGNIWPAFAYWIDTTRDGLITNDCDGTEEAGEDVLWGDDDTTDGFDCLFSAAEFDALTAVPRVNATDPRQILENIVRVDVHLVGESPERARIGTQVGGTSLSFRRRHLASSAYVRAER